MADNPCFSEMIRTPVTLRKLVRKNDQVLMGEDGIEYPIIQGVYSLVPEQEKERDLGDKKFYDKNPFGVRDWSNAEEVEKGVEADFKNIAGQLPGDAWIADVGCGSGRISNYLSNHGFTNVVSIDYSLPSVTIVKKNSKNICVWGNNLCLPFASEVFDFVISTGVIHHTPEPKSAFAECARILKPGGTMYLKLRNIHSPYGYLFKTYGAALRYFARHKKTRFLEDLLGFKVYKLVRAIFYTGLPKFDDAILRGKYENLFIKPLITFFSTSQVKQMITAHNLTIKFGKKTSFTHRQHFYQLNKS